MRNLLDIIEFVKDGGKPDYDELRYALLVIDAEYIMLSNFVLMDLYGKKKLDKFGELKFDNYYKGHQKAMNSDPKIYIGSFDPDLPGYQEDRARNQKIYDIIMRKIKSGEEK
jgi:hypothetical protein